MTRRPRLHVPGPARERSPDVARPIAHARPGPFDRLPDVRDGLTRVERVILYVLHETQRERGGRDVPTAMLYGRVVEHIDISVEELQRVLQRFGGVEGGSIERRPSPFFPDPEGGGSE